MIRIERHPSRSQLMVFGVLWLVFFGFWGTASWWNTGINWKAVLFWSLAFTVPAAGFLWSEFLRIVYVLAVHVTYPIGIIISSVVLMVIYYVVLTPIGVVLRLTGHDPMKRNFDRTAKTYWTSRQQEVETERYFKQF